MEDKKFESWTEAERYIAEHFAAQNDVWANEIIDQSKRSAKRWFAAWLITLAALVGTNAAWIYVFQSYEYVHQYSDGVNNINSGSQGDVINEPESAD